MTKAPCGECQCSKPNDQRMSNARFLKSEPGQNKFYSFVAGAGL
jgi:hypothetical protein